MRTLVASIVALMILCGSPAQAAEYFLDSKNGSDENAGARPDAPFKSLARLSQFSLAPGDVVRLRRGCTFRGQLRFKGNGVEGQPVKVSAYGEGPKPEILGSMWLTDWRPHEGRVHKCAIPPESFVGQKVVYGVFEYDEGRVPVRLQRDKAIPTEPGHFYFDPEALTAYVITSDGAAPANHRLEVSVIDQLVDFADRSWIEVEGLAFLFGNCRHLVLSRCHDVALRGCASLFMGGYGNPNIMIIRGSTRVEIDGCFLYENANCGVFISDGATGCRVANCTIVKCLSNDGVTIHSGGRDAQGIRQGLAGDKNIIANNVIGLCPEESIDITSGDYHTIRGNICYGNRNPGIIIGHDSDHILVQNNICFNNGHAGIYVSGSEPEGARGENVVVGNLVYDNRYPGLEIQSPGTKVFNNTVVNSRERVNVRISEGGRDCVIRNNIIATTRPEIRHASLQFLLGTPASYRATLDHNLFFHAGRPDGRVIQTAEGHTKTPDGQLVHRGAVDFTPAELLAKYGTGGDCVIADPLFAAMGRMAYFLSPGSPALGRGIPVGFPHRGAAPDLGWKELGAEDTAPSLPAELIDGEEDEKLILRLWGKTR